MKACTCACAGRWLALLGALALVIGSTDLERERVLVQVEVGARDARDLLLGLAILAKDECSVLVRDLEHVNLRHGVWKLVKAATPVDDGMGPSGGCRMVAHARAHRPRPRIARTEAASLSQSFLMVRWHLILFHHATKQRARVRHVHLAPREKVSSTVVDLEPPLLRSSTETIKMLLLAQSLLGLSHLLWTPARPLLCTARASSPRAAADADDLPKSSRAARRRARLLGEVAGGTTAEELSSFEELFASLREEEDQIVFAAHEKEMVALIEELNAEEMEEDARPPPPPRPLPPQPPARTMRMRARPLYSPDEPAPAEPPSRFVAAGPMGRPPPPQPEWGAPSANGLESASMGGQLVTLLPTKVMVFVDGTWLYYQLFGRGRRCEITRRWGENWWENHYIDFSRLPQLIADHLSEELMRTMPNAQRAVEVVRVLVFSSFRPDDDDGIAGPSGGYDRAGSTGGLYSGDTARGSSGRGGGGSSDAGKSEAARERERTSSRLRQEMFTAMQDLHFEVHLGEFTGGQEKCVDIALAVDMMHYATVPNAFDVAVLVSGDRDFVPALVRTRQKGKRVAVCSMRSSASHDYVDPAANIKDFSVLWLDDHLDKLVAPVHPSLLNQRPAMALYLQSALVDHLGTTGGEAPYDELVSHLEQVWRHADLPRAPSQTRCLSVSNPTSTSTVPPSQTLCLSVSNPTSTSTVPPLSHPDRPMHHPPSPPTMALLSSHHRPARAPAPHARQLALGEVSAYTYMEHEFGGLIPFVDLMPEALSIERRVVPGRGVTLFVTRIADRARSIEAPPTQAAAPAEAPPAERSTEGDGWADGDVASEGAEPRGTAATAAAVFGTAERFLPTQPRRRQQQQPAAPLPTRTPPPSPPRKSDRLSGRSGIVGGATIGGGGASGEAGRSDGALIVDGSLLELLEEDAFATRSRDDARGTLAFETPLGVADLAHLTVPQLKHELRTRQLSTMGTKPSLLRRLLEALNDKQQESVPADGGEPDETAPI